MIGMCVPSPFVLNATFKTWLSVRTALGQLDKEIIDGGIG
jgi:hypothetical protein